MKKKLVAGLCIITAIFTLSGVFILANLDVITTNHEIKERQERIIVRYGDILNDLKGAQAELYRHQAGYSRDINSLVDQVLDLEELIDLTRREYAGDLGNPLCGNCHEVNVKVATFEKTIGETVQLLARYKEGISVIITLKDEPLARTLERKAAADGEEIITKMNALRHSALGMNEMMEASHVASVKRATYSILVAIVASVILAAVAVFLIMRSITGPIRLLVKGIENVSSGSYDSKVDITSEDEIGYLARTFNAMIDSLNKMTRHRETLMKELQALNDDLERRVRDATEELRRTHERMLRSETLSAVGTFASGVAHELATPLSSIIGYVQMVKGKLPEHLAEEIDIVEEELHRCRNILRGMLSFARAPEKEKAVTDVNEILKDLLSLIRCQAEHKNIAVKEELAPQLPGVMAIAGQLRQVFMNIIVNALQSMPDGGELEVATVVGESGSIVVTISDTGSGIPESEINKIFQPFYTSRQSGTGLGLSICYGIVKGHGGEIEVASGHGRGTAFTIVLPVAAKEAGQG